MENKLTFSFNRRFAYCNPTNHKLKTFNHYIALSLRTNMLNPRLIYCLLQPIHL